MGHASQCGVSRPQAGIGKDRIDLRAELGDDLRGGTLWCADASHGASLVARHEIANGRNIRQRLGSRRCGHGQSAQLAGRDVPNGPRHSVEHDLHLSGKQIDKRGARAAIRHVHEVDTSHHFEEFAGDMLRSPVTTRAMLILPGLALAYAMNSGTVLAGTDGWISITLGTRSMPATGAMSWMKL